MRIWRKVKKLCECCMMGDGDGKSVFFAFGIVFTSCLWIKWTNIFVKAVCYSVFMFKDNNNENLKKNEETMWMLHDGRWRWRFSFFGKIWILHGVHLSVNVWCRINKFKLYLLYDFIAKDRTNVNKLKKRNVWGLKVTWPGKSCDRQWTYRQQWRSVWFVNAGLFVRLYA